MVQIISREYNKELTERGIYKYHINPLEKIILFVGDKFEEEYDKKNEEIGYIVLEKFIEKYTKFVNNTFE